MSKRDPALYLQDIKDAIRRIEDYTRDLSFDDFCSDQKTIDAVIRNLEIIGEAANRLPENDRATYPSVPWEEMVGMRNKIIHEYFGVDLEILWATVKEDIPNLKEKIENPAR